MTTYFRSVPLSIWLIAIAHGIIDMSPGALYAALPFLKAKFSLSYSQIGSIVLMQNLTSSISQPLFGYVSDRKSQPWLMTAGCLLVGFSVIAMLFAPTYPLTFLFIATTGIGSAIFHPQAAKTVNLLSTQAKGRALSVFSIGGNAGMALGSLLLASLLMYGQSALLLIYLLPYLAISLTLYTRKITLPPSARTTSKASSASSLTAIVTWPLVALLGTVMIRATISAGISSFIPLYYINYLYGNQLHAGMLLTVFLAAGAVGTLIGGTLSDSWGSKKVMLHSILPISVMLYLLPILTGAWTFVLLAVTSILLAATATSSLLFIQRMMPNNLGMASGLNLGFSAGLGALGILALGRIADLYSLPLVFSVLAVLPLFGFIMTLFIHEPGAKPASPQSS